MQIFHTQLLPLTTVLSLNIPEAVSLLGKTRAHYQPDIRNLDNLIHVAKELHSLGPRYVLLKGGHLPLTEKLEVPKSGLDKQIIVDVLYDGTDISLIKTAYDVTGIPLGGGYAFACKFSASEAMIFPNSDCHQLQSLPISLLGTRCR